MLDDLVFTPAETHPSGRASRSSLTARNYGGPERRRTSSAMAHWLTLMLDEMDHGLLLVDAGGSLRHANQLGWQALQDGDCLRVSQGRVHPQHADELSPFLAALISACTGRRRMLNLSRPAGAMPVAFVPLPVPDDEGMAMLVLGKRRRCEMLTLDFFARTHGLTAAESKVLAGLCEGLRPKEVAREAGVAVSTVRSQISSIRTKTQTSSIGDLLNRVAVLPPITSAMKLGLSH